MPPPVEASPGQDRATGPSRRHSETIGGSNSTWTTSPNMHSQQADGTARRRRASLTQSLIHSSAPYGIWQATGEVAAKAPTLSEIKDGAFCKDGWTEEGQLKRRGFTGRQIQERRSSRESSKASLKHTGTGLSFSAQTGPGNTHESSSSVKTPIAEETGEQQSNVNRTGSAESQKRRHTGSLSAGPFSDSPLTEEPDSLLSAEVPRRDSKEDVGPDETGTYPNGYRFPPKKTWTQSTVIALKVFWKFFLTPFGFIVTIYCLNIVAWGGMLFLILLKAAPAMCKPTCEDPNSARVIWIEIDSQILNALFCVTGFGLIPWRFRDFYYLMQWRLLGNLDGIRRLAGHNRSWFRLEGSDTLDPLQSPPPLYTKKKPKLYDSPPEWADEELAEFAKQPAIPLPPTRMPPAPLTGIRAPPTKPFLMDVVVWMYVLNTMLQACLAGVMWGLNRFTRPPWVTGFLISLACLVGIVAGLVAFLQGKKVKKVEGIPVVEDPEAAGQGASDVEKSASPSSNMAGRKPEEKQPH